MAFISKVFDNYKIWYYSGYPYEAIIYCYRGFTYIGQILFFKDDLTIPANALHSSGPSLHYSIGRFNDIMSILHHERPLYLCFDPDNLTGMVATDDSKPKGEENHSPTSSTKGQI